MIQKILIVLIAVMASFNCSAQDRVDNQPAQLAYKSKEIKSALYWQQNSKTGKWESRNNTKLVYLGEGVSVDNFNSIFIGEYSGFRYLFLDYKKYSWRYPTLQQEWIYSRMLMQALLSDDDYKRLSEISIGDTVIISPNFYHEMFKGHQEYSFPFFLKLGETLRSSAATLYDSYKRSDGEAFAERMHKKEYPPIQLIVLKRVKGTDGRDVIRFQIYPKALLELIDAFYFEVDYSIYQNLFTPDKKTAYK